jgi:hypothetical protein
MPSAMSTMTETTLSDMKAGFPPLPEPIQGIPMIQSLIELLFHLCRCAQTHGSPASTTMNLLFCAAPRDVYAFLTTEVYPNAFAPFLPEVPNVPDYTVCIDNNDCTTVGTMHDQDKKMQAETITMNTALTDVFLEAMSSQVRASFQQQRLCEPNISLSTSSSGSSTITVRQRPRIRRQTGSTWPPIGTPPMGSMHSSSASSLELRTPAAQATG